MSQTDAIKSSLDRFCAAWKSNDGAALGSWFAEDGTLINPFGQRADGRAAVAAMYTQYFAGMLGSTSTKLEVASIRMVEANHALGFFGVSPIPWLDDVWWARITLGIMMIWAWLGYNTVIMLAGMQTIPSELGEAAREHRTAQLVI